MTEDFSQAVAAEIRGQLGRRQMTQRELTTGIDCGSLNYVATRLRGEASFTLDDLAAICDYLGESPLSFLRRAIGHDKPAGCTVTGYGMRATILDSARRDS